MQSLTKLLPVVLIATSLIHTAASNGLPAGHQLVKRQELSSSTNTASGSPSESPSESATITGTPTVESSTQPPTTSSTSSKSGSSTPSAWISIDDNGAPYTFTPVVTTNSRGSPTTINPAPEETLIQHGNTDSFPHGAELQCTKDKYQTINNEVKFEPFCTPKNGSVWRVNNKGDFGFFFLTWNPDAFPRNSSVDIRLNYANHTNDEAAGVWKAEDVPAWRGYQELTPQKAWLDNATKDKSGNVSFYFFMTSEERRYEGPVVIITTKPPPPKVDTSPSNRPEVNILGLAIGLPLVFLFIVVMLAGTHFCMRERRKIGPIHIGGVRGRAGYGVGRSRRQRMKGAPVVPRGEGYSDEPTSTETPEWELHEVRNERPGRYEGPFRDEAGGRI